MFLHHLATAEVPHRIACHASNAIFSTALQRRNCAAVSHSSNQCPAFCMPYRENTPSPLPSQSSSPFVLTLLLSCLLSPFPLIASDIPLNRRVSAKGTRPHQFYSTPVEASICSFIFNRSSFQSSIPSVTKALSTCPSTQIECISPCVKSLLWPTNITSSLHKPVRSTYFAFHTNFSASRGTSLRNHVVPCNVLKMKFIYSLCSHSPSLIFVRFKLNP